MVLSPLPRTHQRGGATTKRPRGPRSPIVTWIAISLGVFLTGVGIILLLWGMSWQVGVGRPSEIEGEDVSGSGILLPLGVVCLGLGLMWVFTGWTGFRRGDELARLRTCPNCKRMVEDDLNFCYHCMTRLDMHARPPPKAAPSEGESSPRASSLDSLK